MIKYIKIILISVSICACTNYYGNEDFDKVRKFDVHVHLMSTDTSFISQTLKDNFSLLSLNTDAFEEQGIEEQEQIMQSLIKEFPGKIYYVTTFSMANWDSLSWCDSTIARIKNSLKNGAVGIKIWKNIGMSYKDKDSNYIMIDNPRFDPLFNYLTEHHIPVVGHLGDPRSAWMPLDQMTVESDRNYFSHNPQFHLYNNKIVPDYNRQIEARDSVLAKHPDLVFVGAHLGSIEWDVDELARHFDKYPNSNVDIAGRSWYLELQSRDNRQKVRDFLIKYQTRLLYGTDLESPQVCDDRNKTKTFMHTRWTENWQFFTSADSMFSEQFKGSFKGLELPKKVIDNIYYNNAERIFITNKIIN